ncbi:ABC transporter permease [candidate division KSB1 bacterium]|nr:ABC transporter permease [candidate division KSB1 bacterium]
MLKNYFLVALRNLKKYKGYSFINIVGLAIGMACCILILLNVQDELSFDRFHANAETLYRVEQDQFYSGEPYHVNVTPFPMAPALKAEIPEVAEATRVVWSGGVLFRHEEKMFFERNLLYVDPGFLNMFTFPLLQGDVHSALKEPFSVVITREIAEKYFGDQDPVHKVLQLDHTYQLTVTAVLAEVPKNSLLQFDILIPYEVARLAGRTNEEAWGSNSILTFVQLHDRSSVQAVNEKITELRHRRVRASILDNPERLQRFDSARRTQFMLNPVPRIRLYGHFGYGRPMGDIQYVYIFSVIALFVLVIACINFMNLATARSAGRAREIGLRKVVGASKGRIIRQFFSESILLALLALLLAVALVILLLPVFNHISGKELSTGFLLRGHILLGIFVIALLTGMVSGSYPALFLASFQPVKVLQGRFKSGAKSTVLRRILVVAQFSLSIFLMIGTGIVYSQLQYMREKKLGLDKEHVMYIQMRGDIRHSYQAFKDELLKDTKILGVTAGSHRPTFIGSNSAGVDWDGKDPQQRILIGTSVVDYDFIETMKIELLEGRSFSRQFATDTSEAFLVNEEVVKIMGVESAVGKRFSFMGRDGRIIGVMKNFHFKPVRDVIEPLAFALSPRNTFYILIRLSPGEINEALQFVESTWARVIPNYPFDYRFLDEDFDATYRQEERITSLLKYFAAFAILIACLGLLGLASFTAEQRTREVGVRKVFGASLADIFILMSKEFIRWVLIANLIAWPLAFWVMRNWLQSFAYRIDIHWFVFLLSAMIALAVAILTVSYQAISVALSNPAKALKYE